MRVLVPVVYNATRMFSLMEWVRSEVWKAESEFHGSYRRLFMGRVLAVVNLVYWGFNLFGFLIPFYLPRAFKRMLMYIRCTRGHVLGHWHGGNLVTWRSKKQKVVSLSSAEAEFRGIAKGLAEALWIRKLVSEIGFPPRGSTQIMCDNKAAIQISENPVQHDRTKHVKVDRHFIKEKTRSRNYRATVC
nr:putative copia-type protein [Tanacetum cinerariifolium]